MDNMSNALCLFLDGMEVIRNLHPNERLRDAATEAYGSFGAIMHTLNCDKELYDYAKQILSHQETFDQLSPIEQRNIRIQVESMEKHGGIANEDLRSERVVQLCSLIDQLNYTYVDSVENEKSSSDNHVQVTKEQARIITRVEPRLIKLNANGFVINQDQYAQALHYVPDEQLRRSIYVAKNTTGPKILDALHSLIEARHLLAKEFKYPSFAHIVLKDQCVVTPDAAWNFLVKMCEAILPKVQSEMEMLLQKKRSETNEQDVKIHAWDLQYYMGLIKEEMFSADHIHVNDYFSISNCFDGMFLVAKELFGINFVQNKMTATEMWHPSVKKYNVYDEDGSFLGVIYFDLFSRKGKTSVSANFTVKNAKTTINQTPITILVCNFSNHASLAHHQVLTLFHEFGHSLHVLFAQTPFQSSSGTRVSVDFAEAPSQFMEFFACDKRVLKKFAFHKTTGEPIPDYVVDHINQQKNLFIGLEYMSTIQHSMLDLVSYSGDHFIPYRRDGLTTTDVSKILHDRYHVVPFVDGTSAHGRFTHFSSYGACYYSYRYCEVFARHLWHKYFIMDPLSKEAGRIYRYEVLSHGACKDSNNIVLDVLGEHPDPKYVLDDILNNK
ncbi:hypothetical protein AKO1_007287 [Acrasis kona]|uniref:Peptidase M3A/M3B catalytic domain-containing protein n=1 Tax=Acrasis kona TaxID=1008807 RepID=A0AAW2YSN8_9EUKA